MRVALAGLTMAEYFRDEKQQDVLLFVDNIFRFTQAGSEVSALLGRMPSAVGYQPTLATEMGELSGAYHINKETVQSHRFRPYMCLQMTLQTRHRRLHSHIWMPRQYFPVLSQSLVFIRL